MDARYVFRKRQWLEECQVAPEIFEQVVPRLYTFMEPFVKTFQGQAAAQHARTSVCGLLSDVKRKNIASIAYRFGQSRLPLQGFLGWDEWDEESLRQELIVQVKTHLGQGDGVLVFDPSGFAKSGRESVGVARQWCGRLGKVDNCQVAMYLGYVSSKGHTLVDTRLSLPKAWTKDKARLDKAGVPQAVRGYRTRHQLALEMLANHGARLPHRWMAGDDEMGRPSGFGVGWRPWESATWWRCRRTRRYVIWRSSPLPLAVGGVGPHVPGKTSRPGASRLGRRPGAASTCAMVPKARWESRRSRDVSCPGLIGASKAMKRWWWCSATVIETTSR